MTLVLEMTTVTAKTSLTRQVVDQMGAAIVRGAYPTGAVLRTENLQHEYGVSRTVVRDALRTLASLNLILTKRSVGVTICAPHEWDVFARDVIRWRLQSSDWQHQLRSLAVLRVAIEPLAAALAAREPGHERVGSELAKMAQAMQDAGETGDLESSLEVDLAFHLLILTSCGNEMLAALDETVELVLRARHEHRLRPRHPHSVPMILHALVAAAIRDGDAETAEAAMRRLVSEVFEDVARNVKAPTATSHDNPPADLSR